jgi:hypothetical protein
MWGVGPDDLSGVGAIHRLAKCLIVIACGPFAYREAIG